MKYTRVHIERLGYELAPVVVTTDELEERLEPAYQALRIQPGQLELMTGIVERRFWEPGFPVWEGAARAARHALERSAVPPGEIEALIYGGVCKQFHEPATACHVAAALERWDMAIHPGAAVFDVGNACLGVLSGMVEIANRIELGQIRAGMVVSCESSREIVDTIIDRLNAEQEMELFKLTVATLTGGSGAVAVILTDGSFGDEADRRRLLGGTQQAAPRHHWLCRWGMEPVDEGEERFRPFMLTDSLAVLEHGVALGERTWAAFSAEMGWSIEDLDRFVMHQVGSTHRRTILRSLGVDAGRDFVAYDFLGNTGTVALPLALALADERGFVEPGHRVGLFGIGSGLNCLMLGVQW